VNDKLPSVSVIIAARPGQEQVSAAEASRRLDYPGDKLEIIIARGRQPSIQRNAALRAARGELVYFLDDDSVPLRDNLKRAAVRFEEASVQMVGGPNLCPEEAPPLEQVFARVLASWLAFGPSRARYSPVGAVRATSEKELILCNLMARRESMLQLGGFNEALYPNEENALMDELQKRGGKLLYDPEFVVWRRPRSSLGAFARMLMTYGRGRAEQFRVNPTFGSVLNFIPPLFLLYLILIGPALAGLKRAGIPGESWVTAPLPLYVLVLLAQVLLLMISGRAFASLAAAPLIVLAHLLYGFGFWRGLFTRLESGRRATMDVALEHVPLAGALKG
jgi:succinoglycan biosynthesis protein ExoA